MFTIFDPRILYNSNTNYYNLVTIIINLALQIIAEGTHKDMP